MVSLKHGLLARTVQVISFLIPFVTIGAYSQDEEHVLQKVQDALEIQGFSIQEGQGFETSSGRKTLRSQAVRLRWSDQAYLQKEGQADQEGHPQDRVHQVQGQKMQGHWTLQVFRPRCRSHQGKGRSHVLSHLKLLVKHLFADWGMR
jgi:hypothetical protein